jgi:hypothetical protein
MRALVIASVLVGCKPGATEAPQRPGPTVASMTDPHVAPVIEPLAVANKPGREAVGPFEATMMPGRTVWYALPRDFEEHRLVAGLHGQCGGPSYACGSWMDAGIERGFVVCPTGNEHCTSPIGPPSWDESFALMDQDLEKGIAVAQAKVDGGISRGDSVLVGYSRGGWAAIEIAPMHPGRWPYLVLIEADVYINKAYLQAAKVRAVAMVAGEWGTELPGEKKSVDEMKAAGYPAELFVMPKTAHLYSSNFEDVMRDAFAFVLAH